MPDGIVVDVDAGHIYWTNMGVPNLNDGSIRAAELILLGAPFDAERAAQLGLVTQVISDKDVLARATETAGRLAAKPARALQGRICFPKKFVSLKHSRSDMDTF
jgi:1,4-dihydroxy-2-naphthoyl-CoA synthase